MASTVPVTDADNGAALCGSARPGHTSPEQDIQSLMWLLALSALAVALLASTRQDASTKMWKA